MVSSIAFAPFFLIMLIPLVFIIAVAVVIVMIVRALTRRRDDLRLSQEEEMRFRRLLDALDKMERRIDNLETILMQRQRPVEGEKL